MAATSNSEISLTTTPPSPMMTSATGSGGGGGVSAPSPSPSQSRRAVAKAAGSSPWTQIVRGESEPVASAPLSPSATTPTIEPQTAAPAAAGTEEEVTEYGSGNAGKKPAWNKPSNGPGAGAAAAADSGPVMGAHSWPALSETTTRGGSSTKSSTDSLKGLADGSSSTSSSSVAVVSQGTVMANSPSQKQVSNNGNPNSIPTPNHTAPTRQRFPRRSAGSSSNGSLQPPAAQGPVTEIPHNPSPRDHTQKSGYMPQSHGGNDHPQQRNSYRNRNGGSHPRGDASHHHNYGGKRDHDRGNQDWNVHRNFNGRDAHMQPQRVVQRFMRHPPPPPPPPPGSAPFIPPVPLRPVVSPVGFPEFGAALYYVAPPPPDALRGMSFIGPSPPHAFYFHAPDPQLHSRIVNQIDYYFSNENLIKDTYLRQNMDDQGWVPIKLIAGFNKVASLTDNIQLILDALRSSSVVEVQGDKIRRRNDWMRWLLPPHISKQADAQSEAVSRSSSGDFNNQQLQQSSSGGTGQVGVPGGSDLSGKVSN